MLKAIPRYQNYYFTSSANRKIYGLAAEGVTPAIEIVDDDNNELNLVDFFAIKSVLYFTISDMVEIDNPNYGDENEPEKIAEKQLSYYKQDSKDVIVLESKLPIRPELSRVKFDNGNFTIKDFDYKGTPCSDVDNETQKCGFERFFEVNGLSCFDTGLYINVSDGRYNEKVMVRKNGLYFWALGSGRCKSIKLPVGELW